MGPFLVHLKGGGPYFYYDVVSLDFPPFKSGSAHVSLLEGLYSICIGKCFFSEYRGVDFLND